MGGGAAAVEMGCAVASAKKGLGSGSGMSAAKEMPQRPMANDAARLGRSLALPSLVAAFSFVEFGAVVGRFLRNGNVMGVTLPHTGG